MKYKISYTLFFIASVFAFSSCEKEDSGESNLPANIENIVFPTSSIELNVGDKQILIPEVQPTNADKHLIAWSSSNERVAVVKADGEITALGYGRTIIEASFNNIKATCDLVVSEPKRSYTLIWSDEFDGNSINSQYWNLEQGGAGWGNQEKQYYTDRSENARVENGYLIVEAKKENYSTNNYTSARLTTKGKVFARYGKIEARISLPSGQGTWPAFWMMPNSSVYGAWPRSGEIDIMEHTGSQPTMISHALHTQNGSGGRSWSKKVYYDNVENNFHTYTLEWVNDYYNGNDAFLFYVDGNLSIIKDQTDYNISTYADWPFDQDFYVILNLAIGGTWGGTIDDNIFNSPVQMKIDYLRIYEQN